MQKNNVPWHIYITLAQKSQKFHNLAEMNGKLKVFVNSVRLKLLHINT